MGEFSTINNSMLFDVIKMTFCWKTKHKSLSSHITAHPVQLNFIIYGKKFYSLYRKQH